MSSETIKVKIIQRIVQLQDRKALLEIDSLLTKLFPASDTLTPLVKPMRDKLDIEQLKKEQGYTRIDKEKLFQQFDALQIDEPLEDLLEIL